MCLSIAIDRPNDVLSKGEHEGYEFVITRNLMAIRCGYVRIPQGHPWHGKDYDDIDADVHGGLTFAKPDKPCNGDRPDNAWWIGFDCGHSGDAPDPSLPEYKDALALFMDGVVRTTEYVETECRSLCEQAKAIEL